MRGPVRRIPVAVRLARRIGPDQRSILETPCWPFAGARTPLGHGVIRDDNGKLAYAHRIALALALGRPIAPGMLVCHKCDEPCCIRPGHLYEGTKSDNERDKWREGRVPRGDAVRFA